MQIHHKTHLFFILILTSLVVIFLISCSKEIHLSSKTPLSRQNFVLGTIVTISLYDSDSEELLDRAFNKLTELENILSINKTNTVIDTINHHAGITPVEVDEATYHLIKKGLYYSELTSGAFDITIGPLVKLWNIGFPSAHIPSQEEITNKLPLVDYHLMTLDDSTHSVYLGKEGMLLDLGGIGKGYATDEIAKLLRAEGVNHAIINLGGNIYTIGDKPDNRLWTIGVQNPFNPNGDSMGTIGISNQSIVTSGIYERYITAEDGTTYHHILDPSTGYPFTNELAGVSIISDSSTDGDALSTATFALGLENGLTFIESIDGVDAIFITMDYKVYTTSGIKNQFKLTNSEFTLCN
ncbi:MAG: FAD:protein FMN transferase [Cellulosilyticum sp.]|nr:FAD:protein FMN transferase [Cellulosilyticum sp.]